MIPFSDKSMKEEHRGPSTLAHPCVMSLAGITLSALARVSRKNTPSPATVTQNRQSHQDSQAWEEMKGGSETRKLGPLKSQETWTLHRFKQVSGFWAQPRELLLCHVRATGLNGTKKRSAYWARQILSKGIKVNRKTWNSQKNAVEPFLEPYTGSVQIVRDLM